MQSLISPNGSPTELGARDLRIADCTWFLPGEGRDARAEYEAAHIPGAVFLDLAEIVDDDESRADDDAAAGEVRLAPVEARHRRRLPHRPLRQLAPAYRRARLGDAPQLRRPRRRDPRRRAGQMAGRGPSGRERRYDAAALATSPRATTASASSRSTTSAGRSTAGGAGRRRPLPRALRRRGARAARWGRPRPHARRGEPALRPALPSRRHVRNEATTSAPPSPRPASTSTGPSSTTCGSGVTASVLAFALHLLGRDAAVYDGSWAEWGADPATPKATGRA